jgi:prefoldin subunit 5
MNEIWLALLASVPGIAALLKDWIKSRKEMEKLDADAADVLVGTSLDIMKEMKESIEKLQARVLELEALTKVQGTRIAELETGVRTLVRQLEELEQEPAFRIDG